MRVPPRLHARVSAGATGGPFGNWNSLLETGGVVVGDELKITIEVEFTKQTQPQPEPELVAGR